MINQNITFEFLLSALHFNGITDSQREELEANECTYLRRLNLWLFEGDWDVAFEDTSNITEVGQVILGCIPDYSRAELLEEVANQLGIDKMKTWKKP